MEARLRMPSTSSRLCIVAGACLLSYSAPAQEHAAVLQPGSQYRANWAFRLFFGTQWREEWNTGIVVPVVDPATFDGGLTPLRRGGGLQTRSLHFQSASGNEWVFRSVDKDPTRALAPELRDTVIADLYQDLTSTEFPAGAVVVARLLEAVDVLHATPELAVMTDTAFLGDFRDFAGMLGMMEIRPHGGFAGSIRSSHTLPLFARLESGRDEQVDVDAYLRARLVDILVGDWDRHVDQWRWLLFEEGKRIWKPFPVDRDQAFSRFDGIVPAVAEYYTKHLTSFRAEYSSIEKLTYSARFTDRRFLAQLDRRRWEAITGDVVSRLTDGVISEAVGRLPASLRVRGGADLEATLRSRRDKLTRASKDFYELLADSVDVYGTEGADRVSIRKTPETVELTLYRDGKGTERFHRTFRRGETSEIRLYLLGGNDEIRQEGSAAPIHLEIVTGRPPEGARSGALVATAADAVPGAPSPSDNESLRLKYERFRDWGH